jgi:hypothetical protein
MMAEVVLINEIDKPPGRPETTAQEHDGGLVIERILRGGNMKTASE